MNRVILVGNGFDKHVGLNTDYPSLLSKALYKIINNSNLDSRNKIMKVSRTIKGLINKVYKDSIDKNDIGIFYNGLLKVKIKSKFLKELLKSFEENSKKHKNWCDYEGIMYKVGYGADDYEKKCFKTLNSHILNEIKSENNRKSVIKNYNEKVNGIVNILKSDEEEENINKTFICNFNYTDTFEDVAKQIKHQNDISYIHGKLDKDKQYQSYENSDNGDCLFGYYFDYPAGWGDNPNIIENKCPNKYNSRIEKAKLEKFISSDEFELFIIGHSCGKSDISFFRQNIFGSKKCRSVKIMKYDESINKIVDIICDDCNFDGKRIKLIDYPK